MGEHFYGDVGPCTFSAANEWLKAGLKIAIFVSKIFFFQNFWVCIFGPEAACCEQNFFSCLYLARARARAHGPPHVNMGGP